jgi:hypothetical protein
MQLPPEVMKNEEKQENFFIFFATTWYLLTFHQNWVKIREIRCFWIRFSVLSRPTIWAFPSCPARTGKRESRGFSRPVHALDQICPRGHLKIAAQKSKCCIFGSFPRYIGAMA